MYPNPQDVLPLPPHPDLDQYRKRAKELTAASRNGEEALLAWAREWIAALVRLNPGAARMDQRELDRRAHQIASFASARMKQAGHKVSQAQFVLARAHGFDSWPKLVHHVEEIARSASDISVFEQAADAILNGDLSTLERLLRADPGLVHARSDREHRATLLHYASANGVETYRQKTPKNILAIVRLLLDAGAEVDAEADVYGGGATAFALTVTSEHPRQAGVQNALADLLLERGARMDPRIVHYCLVNGCPEAAAHLADLGAPVGVVEAAGIGRLELIRQAFEPPKAVSAKDQAAAMVMAAWYGQREAIELLLESGVDPGARTVDDGRTALHVAAYQGDSELVELLIRHGAPLDVTDAEFGTPPMVWALHAWLVDNKPDAEGYKRVLLALAGAGARVERQWLENERVRGEPQLFQDILQGPSPQ